MSKVDLVILGLLIEKDRHGYDIRQEINKRNFADWANVSSPGIYKGLTRLEAKQMVQARLESGTSHPDRTVYSVTPKGRDLFQSLMREAITHPSRQVFDLLIGIGFCYLLDKDSLLAYLRERRKILLSLDIDMASQREETMVSDYIPENIDFIFDYYLSLIEMELAWLDRLEARITAVATWPEGVLRKCLEKK
ncbi:MAG: PadR family transcriptional regulator [bacterium]|nr:PadR family transcriptional regulator [bacterium]